MNTSLTVFNALYLVHPSTPLLWFTTFCAQYLVYLFPLVLILGWGGKRYPAHCFLAAGVSILLALGFAWVFRVSYTSPRPFVVLPIVNYLHHAATNSFPSQHSAFVFAAAFSLFWQSPTRRWGIGLLLAALLVGWSRIALGAHWPIDILSGAILGLIMSLVANVWRVPLYRLSDALRRLCRRPTTWNDGYIPTPPNTAPHRVESINLQEPPSSRP